MSASVAKTHFNANDLLAAKLGFKDRFAMFGARNGAGFRVHRSGKHRSGSLSLHTRALTARAERLRDQPKTKKHLRRMLWEDFARAAGMSRSQIWRVTGGAA